MKKNQFKSLAVLIVLIQAASSLQAQQTMKENGNLSVEFESLNPKEKSVNLLDGNQKTKFFVKKNTLWIQFQPTDKTIFNEYQLTSANDEPKRDPKNWILKASNDGTEWLDLDSRKDEVFSSRFETKTYSFKNKNAYAFYRLAISENSGAKELQLADFKLDKKK